MSVQAAENFYQPEPMAANPPGGRSYSLSFRPLLGECSPSGRVRLDAIARWLQDVAYSDVEDAAVAHLAHWVVRRTRIHALRFPRFGEVCDVHTFCSAVGAMWAERRTTITLAGGDPQREPLVEALALWVHLDPHEPVPTHVTDAEMAVYGSSIGDRRVGSRLHHPRPTPAQLASGSTSPWRFRRADADLARHVNNTAYWAVLEDALLEWEQRDGPERERPLVTLDAEVEFRVPAQPGLMNVVADGAYRWLTDPHSGEVHASLVLLNASVTAAPTAP